MLNLRDLQIPSANVVPEPTLGDFLIWLKWVEIWPDKAKECRESRMIAGLARRLLSLEADLSNCTCGSVEPLLAKAERRITELKEQFDVVVRNFHKEEEIVDRVWKALGISNYEQAGGKSIDQHVADLKAKLEAQTNAALDWQAARIAELEERLAASLDRERLSAANIGTINIQDAKIRALEVEVERLRSQLRDARKAVLS